MKHVTPEVLQRFLAGESDLMEQEAVNAHLAQCDECAALLALTAAEDDTLVRSLALDEAEAAWIASVDLTEAVSRQLRPWYKDPLVLALIAALVLLALASVSVVGGALLARMDGAEGPVGFTVNTLRTLLPAIWRLNGFLAQGGLLRSLWPVLLVAGTGWFLRSRLTKKEEQTNA